MKRLLILASLLLATALVPSPRAAPVRAQTPGYVISSVITLPSPPQAYDIGWVDGAAHRYYVSDQSHAAVDIFDTTNNTYIGMIPGFGGIAPPGSPAGSNGPDGIVVAADLHQLWAGDGDSTVKVVDLTTNTIIATIPTGGSLRANDLGYDPVDHLMMVGNDHDTPPFETFLSTTSLSVVNRTQMTDATGLQQSVWDPGTGLFYVDIPATKTNPGGEVDAFDPKTGAIMHRFGLTNCNPEGNALGPNHHLLLGCTGDPRNSQIMDDTDGSIVATITQVGGSDEVWYNPSDNRYYTASYGMTSDGTANGTVTPVLGVIDAGTSQWVENVPTVTDSHSVAVDPISNRIYVPLPNVGIGVYSPQ